jgi:hypothetical protein
MIAPISEGTLRVVPVPRLTDTTNELKLRIACVPLNEDVSVL